MKLRQRIRSYRGTRALLALLRPGAVILLYHRVCDYAEDPQLLCVRPARFADHLDYLRRRCRVVSLADLAREAGSGRIRRRTVAITFDDGYADNYRTAAPLLRERGLPAAIFVTAGNIGGETEFWWDELDQVLLAPLRVPARLELALAGVACRWDFPADDGPSPDSEPWNVLSPSPPGPRRKAYLEIAEAMRSLSGEERGRALKAIASWAGVEAALRPDRRCLNRRELKALADEGLIEVGAHTVSHPALSRIDRDSQRAEIRESKRTLEAACGRTVESFAYPFGMRGDYTAESVGLVREAGFARACSNFWGVVYRGADLFQLPRHAVRDWDGSAFARRIEEWFLD